MRVSVVQIKMSQVIVTSQEIQNWKSLFPENPMLKNREDNKFLFLSNLEETMTQMFSYN